MDSVGGWRNPLPPVDPREDAIGGLPAVIESTLAERLDMLKGFVRELTVADLARAWTELQSFSVPRVEPPALQPETRIALRPNVRVLRTEGADGETFYLYDGESETELRIADNPWFRDLVVLDEQPAIDATRWGGTTSTWEETRVLLADLMDKGIIEVRPASETSR